MATHLRRSVDQPIRGSLSWSQLWEEPDQGLILCWERGRHKRNEQEELAERASQGELVPLAWKGAGISDEESNEKPELNRAKKRGSLQYLATWQGLRGEDLDILLDGEREIVCTKTGTRVVFRARRPHEE